MFDISKRDAQATVVAQLAPEQFDFDAYAAYTAAQEKNVADFFKKDSGVLVYRRFRVAEVYGHECSDKALSLRFQLGALQKSMDYAADMANYLEPWYGIGIFPSAFGAQYVWKNGQAPAVRACFSDLEEALQFEPLTIADTPIGQEQLAYLEYFMDQTKGRLPISFGDIQSPLDAISMMLPVTELFIGMAEEPDLYIELAKRMTHAAVEFLHKQQQLLGSAQVFPGHGFASSRVSTGIGASADSSIMISNPMFDALEAEHLADLCDPFGGTYFHSCGNWENKIPSILKIRNLRGIDAAFGAQTDPAPNDPAAFGKALAGTGKILNLRVVGDEREVASVVRRVWQPGLRLIVNTYCETAEQQKAAYECVHEICGC